MSDYARDIANRALDLGAIKLRPDSPFQWASGFRMPIYNDNRMLLFNPDDRKLVTDAFYEMIKEIPFDVIAGTSTAGIPWATSLAIRFDCPMVYVRDKPKDYGLKNRIEGIDADADLEKREVIVIEDLISTGGSSARAVQGVRDANGDANYCVSIFNYGLDKAEDAFAALEPECHVRSLLTYDVLLKVAKERDYLDADQVRLLEEWRADPFGWGAKHGFPRVEKE